MKSNLPQVTNAEAAQKLARKAKAALLQGVSRDWTEAKAKATEAGKLELQSLNLLRTAGVKLQEACDRDKLSFDTFRGMQTALPKDMAYPAAQFCVTLAKQFDEPIKSLDEARAARQVLFQKLSEEQAPRRLEQQTAHDSNPWSELITRGMGVIALVGELQEAEPLDKWSKDKQRSFLSTYKPLVDTYRAVEALAK